MKRSSERLPTPFDDGEVYDLEVASMRWQDVELDSGWWIIPAGMSKNKLAHRVPLSAEVVTLLRSLQGEESGDNAYVLA